MRDFTLDIYRLLLSEIRKAGYSFYTFEEYCRGKAVDKYVILRHGCQYDDFHTDSQTEYFAG